MSRCDLKKKKRNKQKKKKSVYRRERLLTSLIYMLKPRLRWWGVLPDRCVLNIFHAILTSGFITRPLCSKFNSMQSYWEPSIYRVYCDTCCVIFRVYTILEWGEGHSPTLAFRKLTKKWCLIFLLENSRKQQSEGMKPGVSNSSVLLHSVPVSFCQSRLQTKNKYDDIPKKCIMKAALTNRFQGLIWVMDPPTWIIAALIHD